MLSLSTPARAVAPRPWHLLLDRLHGILGLWALGGFLLLHLGSLLPMAHGGPSAWQAASSISRSALVGILNLVLFGIPFVFHVGAGLVRARFTAPNTSRFPLAANWILRLRNLSGVVVLALVIPHVLVMRVQPFLLGRLSVDVVYVQKHLAPILVLDFYVLFVAVTSFHLWSHAWSTAVRFGWTVAPRAQRLLAIFCVVAGVLTTVLGVHVAAAFHDAKYVIP